MRIVENGGIRVVATTARPLLGSAETAMAADCAIVRMFATSARAVAAPVAISKKDTLRIYSSAAAAVRLSAKRSFQNLVAIERERSCRARARLRHPRRGDH